MYPFLRLGLQTARARRAAPLPLDGVHVSRHACLPWDLDPWVELNNGRTLTFYDLGRVPLMIRTGVHAALRREGWRLTVAGAQVRYRQRVQLLDRLDMRSALIGRDARFFYVHQSLWRGAEACSAAVFRKAVTGGRGIVPTDRVLDALGAPDWNPPLPEWVAAWSAAEARRPWPPVP